MNCVDRDKIQEAMDKVNKDKGNDLYLHQDEEGLTDVKVVTCFSKERFEKTVAEHIDAGYNHSDFKTLIVDGNMCYQILLVKDRIR